MTRHSYKNGSQWRGFATIVGTVETVIRVGGTNGT